MAIQWAVIIMTLLAMATPWLLKFAFPHKVCYQEIAISTGLSLLIGLICFGIFTATIPRSTEILNGLVTDKQRVQVPCSHTYCCQRQQQCTTDSNGNRSCRDVCVRRCTRHSHDYDWRVFHNIDYLGRYINISRIDSQGRREPPRWSAVEIGEPFSRENTYRDYIKAAPNSIHYRQNSFANDEYDETIPPYPNVYDLYRSRNVVSTHPMPNSVVTEWNETLRKNLGEWGPAHHLNIVIVFTQHPRDFAKYLSNEWMGGRKNDAVLVFGVNSDFDFQWFEVFSWSRDEYFNSHLRAHVNAAQTTDLTTTMNILSESVGHFDRINMEDYRYLLRERTYSWWQLLIVLVLQLVGNGVLGYFVATRKWFDVPPAARYVRRHTLPR